MHYHISEEDFNTLQTINEALGEIYTKGQDSVIIVKVRTALLNVLNNIYEEAHASEHLQIHLTEEGKQDIKEE